VHAVVRTLQQALGLGERYEFWLRELVRINYGPGATFTNIDATIGRSTTPAAPRTMSSGS